MTNVEKIRFLLDNQMTMRQIAAECRVTVFHLNKTLAGERKGGSFVTQRLDVIVQEMQDSIDYLAPNEQTSDTPEAREDRMQWAYEHGYTEEQARELLF